MNYISKNTDFILRIYHDKSLRRADTDSTIEMFFEDYETYDGKNDTPMIGFSNSTY